jgi:ACT domain-containing protein
MQRLELERIPVGSILATEIRDDGDRVLLNGGATLSESVLQGLRRHGINSACVFIEAQHDEEMDPAQRQKLETRLAQLLRNTGDSDATSQLHQALLDFYLEHKG